MSEHIIYGKPVTVTEERLKEALVKQAKQKAMKEALDRQILEAERVKREEARKAHRRLSRGDEEPSTRPPRSPSRDAGRVSPRGVSREAKAHRSPVAEAGKKANRTPSPTGAGEVARYTFSFEGDQARFVQESGSPTAKPGGPAGLGGGVGIVGTAVSYGNDTSAVSGGPAEKKTNNRKQPPVATGPGVRQRLPLHAPAGAAGQQQQQRSPPSSRTPSSQPKSARDAIFAALAEPKKKNGRGVSRERRGVAGTPTYQTNSLPVNLDEYEVVPLPGKAGALAGSPTPGDAANRRRGISKVRKKPGSGEPVYDTQSLPVDLTYRLGRKDAGDGDAPLALGGRLGMGGGKRLGGQGVGARRGQSPVIEVITPASDAYDTGCLPRNFALDDDLSKQLQTAAAAAAAKKNGRGAGAGVVEVPLSSRPPSHGGLLGPKGTVITPGGGGGGAGQGYTRDGRKMSPRTPGRPMGGVLPPLRPISQDGNASVIEMSAVLDNADGASNSPARTPPSRDSHSKRQSQQQQPQQKQPATRERATRRLQDKERSWADQVQRLKAELRSARKKERELAQGNRHTRHQEQYLQQPQRAETAPDPPSPSKGADEFLGGGRRPTGGRSSAVNAGNNSKLTAVRGGRAIVSPEGRVKMDFARARVFTAEEFRPITAPDLPEYSYVPSSNNARGSTNHPNNDAPHGAAGAMVMGNGARGRHRNAPSAEPLGSYGGAIGGGGGGGVAGAAGMTASRHSDMADTTTNSSVLNMSESSLKLASLTTRQTTFGLPEEAAETPAPIAFEHLLQFAEAQIITEPQAESLWTFFCSLKGVAVQYDDSGKIARRRASHRHLNRKSAANMTRSLDSTNLLNGDGDVYDEEEEDEEEDKEEEVGMDDSFGPSASHRRGERAGSHEAAINAERRRRDYHQSPSPVSAVLAPALREKITKLHAAAAVSASEGDGDTGESTNKTTNHSWGNHRNHNHSANRTSNGSFLRETPPPMPSSGSSHGRPSAHWQTPLATPLLKFPEKRGSEPRVVCSLSLMSHSSEGALDGEPPLSGRQSVATSRESGRASQQGTRPERVESKTFDTSVELFARSDV